MTLREGDRITLKATPWNRKRGYIVHNHYAPNDCYIRPGEVGVVTRTTYRAHNGEDMATWRVEFERGRGFALKMPACETAADYVNAKSAEFYRDAEEFKRVK